MNPSPPQRAHSQRYIDALGWAAELHCFQTRKGKSVPYISHLIAVSGLVWEDGGTEDQAIAGLLHDAIEDAGQSHSSIHQRFGKTVADIVQACTDTDGPTEDGAVKAPWIERKTAYIEKLAAKPQEAWLVTAADKAHNARDMVLDAQRHPDSWDRFRAGLDGSAWYLWSLHRQLKDLLPQSRSVALLGQSVQTILGSPALQAKVPAEQSAEEWVAQYLDRPDTHPKD
ncbi:MAG: HD domain-containing protein [Synechococcaceae cyanobacterium]|nr:HD domain-containing protein [Synechococcaceae cyanobacterium]